MTMHNQPPLDRIHIKDLLLRCIIGILEWERTTLQDVVINCTLHVDLRSAGLSDDIADTVNYKALNKNIIQLVEGSAFFLVEAMAEAIAELCLQDRRVKQCEVTVEKPGALRFARSVGVTVVRGQHG
ncbi:dihydroneopterin aldolase [Magnetococcus marinus MC-1]|uniref:7,8-dihydroneopterin aldolase n=1 Tax=Magnetococcus marinus (strain ATCC BAA-1437 / JCM 17883 / MC-1) TaxID=156889 RepID=A0L4G2_MAGMM|nr:dihydroneopterin aldolase [Magnetococcus marinus]ABK42855.1 dihydroneopterin aldolase [Magnetococcus marinus MC-1]